MKTFFKGMKRGVAMLLAVLMIVSASNVQAIAQLSANTVSNEDAVSTTLGELILSNYDLSAKEEALIGSGWLSADKGYSYILPPEEVADGGLISVDEDNKKVTVSAYEDTQGNLWIPVSFDLKNAHGVIAGHDDLPLAKEGNVYVGTYTAGDNQFSVEVTYKLEINVSEAEQKALLEAGEKIAADIDVLKILDTADIFADADSEDASKIAQIRDLMEEALGQQATLTPELALMFMVAKVLEDGTDVKKSVVDVIHGLTEKNQIDLSAYGLGTYDLYMKSAKAKEAAARLLAQQTANSNLDLTKYLVIDHLSDSYLKWLMVYGDSLKAVLNTNYDDLYYMANNNNGLNAVSGELELLLEDLGEGDAIIFNTINEMIADAGYSYTITSEQQLADQVANLKSIRASKMQELNTLMSSLGYDQEIKNADDIDGAITFLETYDPYVSVDAQVKQEVAKLGLDASSISIKNDADFANVYNMINMAQQFGLLSKTKADEARAMLESVQAQALDFTNNRAPYIQELRDGQATLRQVDAVIPLLEELQAALPGMREELNKQRQSAKDNKAMLDMLIFVMEQLCQTMKPVYDKVNAGTWNTPTVVNTQKAVDYDLLTTWVQGLQTTNVAVKENLSVETATVRYNMSMFNVRVVVKAEMVNPLLVDSAATVALPDYESAVVTLRKGADKQEVMDAIAELAADAAALAQPQWNGVITAENYVRTADELAENFSWKLTWSMRSATLPRLLALLMAKALKPVTVCPPQCPTAIS